MLVLNMTVAARCREQKELSCSALHATSLHHAYQRRSGTMFDLTMLDADMMLPSSMMEAAATFRQRSSRKGRCS